MRCSELMKTDVECCLDATPVTEAAKIMRDRRVGFLPICDAADVIVGTLTDRDIALRVLAASLPVERTRVTDVMSRELVACSPSDDLDVAEDLMIRHRKSRIVCVDAQRRIAGVISLSDIAKRESRGHAGTIAASVATREAQGGLPDPRTVNRSTPCRDIMKMGLKACHERDYVPDIAAIMRDNNIGFVPVVDESGALIGAITDRDLVVRVVAEGLSAEQTNARDALTSDLVLCFPDDPLGTAEDLMIAHRKSRIVCVDHHRSPVGVISLSDLARVERSKIVSGVLREVTARGAHP